LGRVKMVAAGMVGAMIDTEGIWASAWAIYIEAQSLEAILMPTTDTAHFARDTGRMVRRAKGWRPWLRFRRSRLVLTVGVLCV
jgi:hypothetical protein